MDAEEKGREVDSNTISVWVMGTRGLSVDALGEKPRSQALGPEPVYQGSFGHGGYVPQGVEAEPVESDLQFGRQGEEVDGVRGKERGCIVGDSGGP